MREYAVQNYAYSTLMCFCAHMCKFFVCAKQRVGIFVIAGIVAVIGIGFEYGIQIYGIDSHSRKIIKLLFYSGKIAAVKIVGGIIILARAFTVFRRRSPVLMHSAPQALPAARSRQGGVEPVGKNLIHYGIGAPSGSFIILRIKGYAEGAERIAHRRKLTFTAQHIGCIKIIQCLPVLLFKKKIVAQQAGLRSADLCGKAALPRYHLRYMLPAVPQPKVCFGKAGGIQRKGYRRSLRNGPAGAAEKRAAGIVQHRCLQSCLRFHIFSLYSPILRSEEKYHERAIFIRLFFVHSRLP